MSESKTNVLRFLDSRKIKYNFYEYPHGNDAVDGVTVAQLIGKPVENVYKTLVAMGADKKVLVFVVPVAMSLNLKKAAKAARQKSIEMVKVLQINELTGYIRGGCSPIGMKKLYKTYMDSSAQNIENIIVSAGKIGMQVELEPQTLQKLVNAEFADIAE